MTHTLAPVPSVERLEDWLSEPTPGTIETFRRLGGDVLVLGAGGKMGLSLARMAKRASEAAGGGRQVVAVSRFATEQSLKEFERHGIRTLRCNLLDDSSIAGLPESANVIFLAGMKFGSTGQEALTWAMNSYLPAIICRRYPRSRIVALSTGNVYGLTPVAGGGSRESDPPAPVGEYAMSCLGRERIFEHFSRQLGLPVALIRLNYACDLRYGVLVDLAQRVWRGETIDLAVGCFNTIWQGDANAMILQALSHAACPPRVLNVTGPEVIWVRAVCEEFGELMNRKPRFAGTESPTALLSNAEAAIGLFGAPRIAAGTLVRWVANWVMEERPTLSKPTHFESRDGKF